MFYDKSLNKIDYNSIVWDIGPASFGNTAKSSQIIYFLKKYFTNKKICIVHFNQFDEDIINNSDIDFLLVNCSDHPYSLPTYNLKKYNLVLDSDFTKQNYWPFHLLFSSYLACNEEVDLQKIRPFLFNCINRSPRISRIYNTIKLKSLDLPQMKLNWFHANEANGPVPEADDIIKEIGLENYKTFLQINKQAPVYQSKTEYQLCSSISDYVDAYLNLVTESRLEPIGFLTEKIYKPIRAGQLFLIQGPPGTIKFLRECGFDTFDDLIDHNYDNIHNWIERTDYIHTELKRIFLDIEKIYFETTERRLKNLNVLKHYENNDPWTNFIVNQINS
jgi:hypothetical protein